MGNTQPKQGTLSHEHTLFHLYVEQGTRNERCDVCRKKLYGLVYVCDECKFWRHRSCASKSMPLEINHPFHSMHELELTDSYEGANFLCERCSRNSRGPRYHCQSCHFDVDLACASDRTSQYGVLEGRVRKRLKHFSHGQILALFEYRKTTKYYELDCSWCDKRLSGWCYGCFKSGPFGCKFFLHESCISKIPHRLQHPFHPLHPLYVQYDQSLSGLFCNACEFRISPFDLSTYYACHTCRFYLHISCARLQPTLKHKCHKHELTQFLQTKDRNDFDCNYCGRNCNDKKNKERAFYRCVQCDFNIHLECLPAPVIAKHRYHRHFLALHPGVVEDDSGEYYCDVCEEERNPKYYIYYCKKCEYIAHVECVLKELSISEARTMMGLVKRVQQSNGKFLKVKERSDDSNQLVKMQEMHLLLKDLEQEQKEMKKDKKKYLEEDDDESSCSSSSDDDDDDYDYETEHNIDDRWREEEEDVEDETEHDYSVGSEEEELEEEYNDNSDNRTSAKNIEKNEEEEDDENEDNDNIDNGESKEEEKKDDESEYNDNIDNRTSVKYIEKNEEEEDDENEDNDNIDDGGIEEKEKEKEDDEKEHNDNSDDGGSEKNIEKSEEKEEEDDDENEDNDNIDGESEEGEDEDEDDEETSEEGEEKEKLKIKHFSHNHLLKISHLPESYKLCNACFHALDGTVYICETCEYPYRYGLHKSCTNLPPDLQHPSHPDHSLTLLQQFPHSESGLFLCDECRTFSGGFVYLCLDCGFKLEVKCATSDAPQRPKPRQKETKSLHFSHKHELVLGNGSRFSRVGGCSGCGLPILGPAYCCLDCLYIIHESCIRTLPEVIRHPFHPPHPLVVTSDLGYGLDEKYCFACKTGFSLSLINRDFIAYGCEQCKVYLHLVCANSLRSVLKSKSHVHDLYYFGADTQMFLKRLGELEELLDKFNFSCGMCNLRCDGPFYRCVECAANFHLNCVGVPGEIKSGCHLHTVILKDFFVEDDSGEYYCDVCEKERHMKDHVYCCEECDGLFAAHVECVLNFDKVFAGGRTSPAIE